MNTTIITRLPVAQIARDAKLQVRDETYAWLVRKYADVLRSGGELLPVKVAMLNGVPILYDGWHRLAARVSLREGFVDCEVREANTRQEIMLWAVEANLKHGQPLKSAEVRRALAAFIKADGHVLRRGKVGRPKLMTYEEIAKHFGRTKGWAFKWINEDHPEIAKQMRGSTPAGRTEDDPEDAAEGQPQVTATEAALGQVKAAFAGTSDAAERRAIVHALVLLYGDLSVDLRWSERRPEEGDF